MLRSFEDQNLLLIRVVCVEINRLQILCEFQSRPLGVDHRLDEAKRLKLDLALHTKQIQRTFKVRSSQRDFRLYVLTFAGERQLKDSLYAAADFQLWEPGDLIELK